MARSLGDSRQALAPEDLLGHLEPLLQPPIQHLIDPAARDRPLLRGLFAGRRTTLRLEPFVLDFVDDGSSFLTLEMEGATYGVVCAVAPILLWLVPRYGQSTRVRTIGSVVLFVLSTYWFFERVLGRVWLRGWLG